MNAPAAERFVGKRVRRKEDARLLTGRGSYTDDVVVPGMLHVAFVRSPIARGNILSIDTEAAKGLPGVFAVFTADDLAAIPCKLVSSYMVDPPLGPKVPPLASGRVVYVGDPVVLVIAQDRYVAEDAAALVEVEYEEEDPVVTIGDARQAGPIHPDMESNISMMNGQDEIEPDLAEIFRSAAHVVEGTLTHQRVAHSPMETRGIVVSPNGDRELTVWMGCQGPHLTARQLALSFSLPETGIRVIAKDVGGSFGLKAQTFREDSAVIAASLLTRRPLKWIEDRIENLISANQSREQECTLKIAFDADARLLGAHLTYAQNVGAYPYVPDDNMAVALFMWGAYKMPRFGYVTRGYHSNTVGICAYRGPWAMESLMREAMLDVAARQIGISPVEIRRRNLIRTEDQPTTSVMGLSIEDIRPYECLEKLLAEKFDVAAFRKEQEAARAEDRYLGLGFATYIEPTVLAMPTSNSDVAQIRLEPHGKVTAVLTTHSQGHGTETTMAQVIADELGVDISDIVVHESDSANGGYGVGAGGSRQAVSGGGAAIHASRLLVEKIRKIAAHISNANLEAVSIVNGTIHIAGAQEMQRSFKEIAEIAYNEPERLPPGMESGLEAQYRYVPPPIVYASAAHACVVEVDRDTGFVKILRWICSEDCGVLINPAIVEGQIAGGIAQAIGTVLFEDFGYDARGNPVTATFKDYVLPTIFDVPDFEYTHICTPSQGAGGFRGVGEGGTIVGAPTLVNAIADALSPFTDRCLTLPLSPSRLLALMDGVEEEGH